MTYITQNIHLIQSTKDWMSFLYIYTSNLYTMAANTENNPLRIEMHNYFTTVRWEHEFRDAKLETIFDGICTCLAGLGWNRDSVIQEMEEYAYEHRPIDERDESTKN